jgi:hypothetical protein
MPANLNALIRYKQIDKCLRNKYVNCTIERMRKKCSEQLAEHRGIYKLVSERTLREDLKTMRSSALGFNAPIVVKDGVYNYSDDSYSIFKTSIEDATLLKMVLELLLEEREKIKNPNLDKVLEQLKNRLDIELTQPNSTLMSMEQSDSSFERPILSKMNALSMKKKPKQSLVSFTGNVGLSWQEILNLV